MCQLDGGIYIFYVGEDVGEERVMNRTSAQDFDRRRHGVGYSHQDRVVDLLRDERWRVSWCRAFSRFGNVGVRKHQMLGAMLL